MTVNYITTINYSLYFRLRYLKTSTTTKSKQLIMSETSSCGRHLPYLRIKFTVDCCLGCGSCALLFDMLRTRGWQWQCSVHCSAGKSTTLQLMQSNPVQFSSVHDCSALIEKWRVLHCPVTCKLHNDVGLWWWSSAARKNRKLPAQTFADVLSHVMDIVNAYVQKFDVSGWLSRVDHS